MLIATCHCGAVRVEVPTRPRTLTDCNCSICRRYGTRWAYYKASSVRVIAKRGATAEYAWGHKTLRFVRCADCGCVTHWEPIKPNAQASMGINARNFEPSELRGVRIRLLDGADTWKYLS